MLHPINPILAPYTRFYSKNHQKIIRKDIKTKKREEKTQNLEKEAENTLGIYNNKGESIEYNNHGRHLDVES